MKEVYHKLVRLCTTRKIEPLSLIHSTQRIVHSFMKENDFTPSIDDQQVLEKVADFTAGSPLLVDITSQVVNSCFGDKEEPIQALEEFFCLSQTRSSSRITVGKNLQYIWATSVKYDSWNSLLTLVDACGLTMEEKLLLNSLSIFSCSPIPFSMVTKLASTIAKSAQKQHLAGTLHCNLIKYKLICVYPHPVVLHPSVVRASSQQELGFDFVYVPQYLSQCIWKSLENIDKVVAYSLAYHTLVALHQNVPVKKDFENQFNGALCSLLFESIESDYELVGKECYQAVYSLFLTYMTL